MTLPDDIRVYGDITYRGACATEAAEAATFFNRIRKTPHGAIATHIKNEGKRNSRQVAQDRAQGMVKGASDIIIPGCPSLVIEMKRRDHTKSRVSDEQLHYLRECAKNGAVACLALGVEGAWEIYLKWSVDIRNA